MLETRFKARLWYLISERKTRMDELLVNLVGATEGAERSFDEWRLAALSQGLQPQKIQQLKRRGLVHTRLDPVTGEHFIVRGAKPVPQV